ncbi:hypothetical protein RDI58_029443 [Solanum bulbocastanum]|uniref:Uncharacterized protein n=1 Tax=Solanum bulbocastanum TaxID=147425 RepID=A0AAN8XZY3_SOLBU
MRVENKDKFDDEKIKTKIHRLKTDTKTFKDLLNACSGYYGLKDYDTLYEIFGNSFVVGDKVMYIKNPNFSSKSNDVIVEENEPFDCDDEHVVTKNTCQPMSLNTDGSGSEK